MRVFALYVKFFAHYFWLCRAVLFTLMTIVCGNGFLFAYLENKSIFSSIYFILITALTIGYGDITPATTWGRIISVITGTIGVIIVGLIIAISNLALNNTVRTIFKDKINPI